MGKPKEMIGKTFERLTVILLCDKKDPENSREYWYSCKCECGNYIEVRGTSLRNGSTKSCGCLRTEMLQKRNQEMADTKFSLAGRKYNKLLVLELLNLRNNGQRLWRCLCDCGNYHNATTNHLLNNAVKSCGCIPTNIPVDFTGERFGWLVALKVTQERKSNGGAVWLCRCDCGNEVCVPAGNLKRGTTKSCGCIRRVNLVGQRFGNLTVLRLGKKSGHGDGSFWVCKCECGNECEVHASKLKSGHTGSCGCSHQKLINNIVNKKFGEITVIEDIGIRRNKAGGVIWKCKCSCGEIKLIRQDSLLSGNVQSCGCVKSRGNAKIASILRDNGIAYIAEYSPIDLNGRYRFDFAIKHDDVIKYFIEYDGELHFGYNGKGWNTEERYQKTLKSDRIKNEYCMMKGLPLIRIPYTSFQCLSLADLVLYNNKHLNT